MRQEARFQIRGEVTDCRDETYNDSRKCTLVLRVQGSQDKSDLFEVRTWGDELCRVAVLCKGKQVLALGRLAGGKNERGYFNVWLRAEALLVQPGDDTAPTAAVGSGVASPQQPHPSPHKQAKANGYQPQAKPEDPLPWEENMAKDDIPF